MKPLSIVLLVIAAACAHAVPPAEPGALLVQGENDAEWKELFERLAPRGPVLSVFTERRHFPFRQQPTVLRGEMRLHPARGLSLHYTEPEQRTVIVDDQGLAQRDARGRLRAMPADAHAAAVNTAMLPVLRFDQAEIARRFDVHAARDGDDWRLDFVPRDAVLARALGRFIAWGQRDELQRLEFRRSEKQRVEIVIEAAERGTTFSEAQLSRYFR